MNGPPSPYMYKDPNERLLASVVPTPPLPLRTRIWRRIEGFWGPDGRRARAGILEFEAWHLWIVAGAASAGLLVGVYRSELSSAARAVGDKVPNVQLRGLRASEPPTRNATVALREPNGASPERTRPAGERSEDAAPLAHRSSTQSVALQKGAAEPGAGNPNEAKESATVALQDGPGKPAVRRSTSRAARHRAMLAKKAAKARARKRIAKASRRGKARVASGSKRSTSRRAVASRARAIAFGRQ